MTSYQPPGYHAVTPWVISRDTARMIEFAQEAFGAAELGRVPDPAGGSPTPRSGSATRS